MIESNVSNRNFYMNHYLYETQQRLEVHLRFALHQRCSIRNNSKTFVKDVRSERERETRLNETIYKMQSQNFVFGNILKKKKSAHRKHFL